MLEPLEDRTLMSGTPTISWDGGAGPADLNWPTVVNWTDDRLPHVNDDVGIAVPGEQITIRLDTLGGPVTAVHSLHSEENLEVRGGLALTVGGELTGSLTLSDGPLELPSGADLTLRGGATVDGPLHLAAGGILRLQGGTYGFGGGGTIAGTIEIAADATVRFTGGNFLLQAGAALTGEGVARIVGANFDIAGPVSARRVELDYTSLGGHSYLAGAGRLTVSESSAGPAVSCTGQAAPTSRPGPRSPSPAIPARPSAAAP